MKPYKGKALAWSLRPSAKQDSGHFWQAVGLDFKAASSNPVECDGIRSSILLMVHYTHDLKSFSGKLADISFLNAVGASNLSGNESATIPGNPLNASGFIIGKQ